MKATRHNGRSGKHGTYNPKHNDREFDEENSEHIDAERTKFNVYWDCYQGYSLPNDENERARFTFSEVEKAYYVENYSDHVDGQNERNRKARHYDRVKTIDSILENNKTCPEETLLQLGNIDGTVSADVLAQISAEYFEEFNKRYGSHVHILDWALHLDEATPHIHERHVFDNNEIDKLKERIAEANHELEQIDDDMYSCNPVLNSILRVKIGMAKKENIACSIEMMIPTDFNMEYGDMGILYGNLLDNAIEACSFVEPNKRFIRMKSKMMNGNLIISVINSKQEKRNAALVTTKPDKENHGRGVRSIRKVVDKYDGTIEFEDKGETFEVTGILYEVG